MYKYVKIYFNSNIYIIHYSCYNFKGGIMKKLVIMYDWDQTLSPNYMSEYGMIKKCGFSSNGDYWKYCNDELSQKYGMDRELSFLYSMVARSKQMGWDLTRKSLNAIGKKIEYFPGVLDWFERINKYGLSKGVVVEHYIISSGIYEIIEGSKIFNCFRKVFASSYAYDERGVAMWPAFSINYTSKTQYIFRIKKNLIDDITDDSKINVKYPFQTVVPYSNMIYMGDGLTDIPCMKIVKDKGGNSFCLYTSSDPASEIKAKEILHDGRVNYIVDADYREGMAIDTKIKNIIDNLTE